MPRPAPTSPLFPYTTLFRSESAGPAGEMTHRFDDQRVGINPDDDGGDAAEQFTDEAHGGAEPVTAVFHKKNGREDRSEEHTSELQSHVNLVCRLLLEKKN